MGDRGIWAALEVVMVKKGRQCRSRVDELSAYRDTRRGKEFLNCHGSSHLCWLIVSLGAGFECKLFDSWSFGLGFSVRSFLCWRR